MSSTPRRIIIPAAGAAVRFGGVPKEMLPISEEETLLGRAVRLARTLGKPMIISSRKKNPSIGGWFPTWK